MKKFCFWGFVNQVYAASAISKKGVVEISGSVVGMILLLRFQKRVFLLVVLIPAEISNLPFGYGNAK